MMDRSTQDFFLHLALVCALAFSFVSEKTFASGAITILPVGDSITEGDYFSITYRRDLWLLLNDQSLQIDFVGSKNTADEGFGDSSLLDFDMDYEAYYGWTTEQVNAVLPNSLTAYSADIALVHLGTNDIYYGEAPAAAIADIAHTVSILRAHNAQITILLAQLIPMRDTDVSAFNSEISTFALSNSNQNSQIIVVDHFTGYDPQTLNKDNWHPNSAGEAEMAARWFAALQPILSTTPEEVAVPLFSTQQLIILFLALSICASGLKLKASRSN